MIAIIRIKGKIGINRDVNETLDRLRLRKKYACVILNESAEIAGMLKKVRNFVAYGKIDAGTLKELIEKRGKLQGKNKEKTEIGKIAGEIMNAEKPKKLGEYGLKPFFSLHPPRGGIKSKLHYPKGVLGDNKEKINELIKRML